MRKGQSQSTPLGDVKPPSEAIGAKRLNEKVLHEDAAVSEPSTAISKELAEKIRDKYFPKKERAVKIVKRAARLEALAMVEKVETDVATDEEYVTVRIPSEQFELLSVRTKEILTQAALAQERIAKDQEEIDSLKMETRETLRQMRAA